MKNKNLWAPWRIDYLKSLENSEGSKTQKASSHKKCFFCEYCEITDKDRENLVLWRTQNSLTIFNRFPYTAGHLLIAPRHHVPNIDALDKNILLEIMLLSCDAQIVLDEAIHPHGYNIGFNINRCAGAGMPDHVHLHLVPRWQGDTNFMDVIGNIRVISQSLTDLYDQLTDISKKLNLPTVK